MMSDPLTISRNSAGNSTVARSAAGRRQMTENTRARNGMAAVYRRPLAAFRLKPEATPIGLVASMGLGWLPALAGRLSPAPDLEHGARRPCTRAGCAYQLSHFSELASHRRPSLRVRKDRQR